MVNFNLQCFLDAASELVRADEVARALHLLDNLPAFYRAFPPQQVIDLKNEIMSRIAMERDYAKFEESYVVDVDNRYQMDKSVRGIALIQEVEHFNSQGLTPHIRELGPGELFIPMILKNKQLKFTYDPVVLNEAALASKIEPFKEFLLLKAPDDQPIVFIALEVIEHLWNEQMLKFESLRSRMPDTIHISTPQFAYDTGCTNWREREWLGHLRTYTPAEFYNKCGGMFPEYSQVLFVSQIMHSRLILKTTKFNPLTEVKYGC